MRTSLTIFLCAVIGVAGEGCSRERPGRIERGSSHEAGSRAGAGIAGPGSWSNPARLPTPSNTLGSVVGDICASALVYTARTTPTIVFVIDGSGSMCAPYGDPYGGSTRWQSLRAALLQPNVGLIYRLQNAVRFGATLYDGTIDMDLAANGSVDSLIQNPPCALITSALAGKGAGMCPLLVEAMPPALNNAQAIDGVYPENELGGSTPTDRALDHVMNALIAAAPQQQGPDAQATGKTYVILATDGAPNDICVGGVGGDGSAQRQAVIAAVDRGAAAGITTWVISLADGDPNLQTHLDEVARHGEPMNPSARTFSPTSPDELITTLAQLLGGAVGCHIELDGNVTAGQECTGKVEQNGMLLPCCQETAPGALMCEGKSAASPEGWRLIGTHAIELLGSACASYLLSKDVVLQARFPCEVFRPD